MLEPAEFVDERLPGGRLELLGLGVTVVACADEGRRLVFFHDLSLSLEGAAVHCGGVGTIV